MRSFLRPASTFSPYDPGSPRVEPDVSTPARLTAVQIEDEFRRDAAETGAFIAPDGRLMLRKTGLPNRVGFLPEELTGMSGATFTHNHPGGLSFSLEDIVLAWELRLTEVRVVTTRFRHLAFAFTSVAPDEKELHAAYDLDQRRLVAQTRHKVIVEELHPADFGTEVQHLTWVRLSRKYDFTYLRENS